MANKISNSLVTLSSAAILAVYAAGYQRTAPAAERFAVHTAERRVSVPSVAASAPAATVPALPAAPASPLPKKPASLSPPPKTVSPEPLSAATAPAVPIAEPAPAPTEVVPAPAEPVAPVAAAVDQPKAPQVQYKDGTYLGWGYSRHGDIQAFVRIEEGRIVAAGIEKCWTRYSCSWIEHLPPQVVARQSPDVDYVSGATQSVDAFYGGIVEALAKAK